MLVFVYTAGTPQTSVPRVVGQTKSAALERLAKRHLHGKVIRSKWAARRLPSRFAGQIVHQTWKQGVTLPEGGVVTLTLFPRHAARRPRN
jgi:beta-lactam-binding protein with PASTA domain